MRLLCSFASGRVVHDVAPARARWAWPEKRGWAEIRAEARKREAEARKEAEACKREGRENLMTAPFYLFWAALLPVAVLLAFLLGR
jgi:hypothetical protein